MPKILVVSEGAEGREPTTVMEESVRAVNMESDHYSAQLVERLGWALADADDIEHVVPSPHAAA